MFPCACIATCWRCSGVTEKPRISGVALSHNMRFISGVTESIVGTPSSDVGLLMFFPMLLILLELIIRLLICKLHANDGFLRFWLISVPNWRTSVTVAC